MATIIQNLACFEVHVNAKSGRFYFDEDILQGKTIKDIWLLFSDQDAVIISPFTKSEQDKTYLVSPYDSITEASGIFLNIIDTHGKTVAKNLSLQYLMLTAESNFYDYFDFAELHIDRKIDTKNSYFNCFMPFDEDFVFLMYVSYEDTAKKIKDFNTRGSFSVEIPLPGNEIADIRLSDYIPRAYRSYEVKQIIFTNEHSSCYLDIKAENSYIENIPNFLLYNKGTNKNIFFDNIKIDYEESFLRLRGQNNEGKEKITFIY